MHSRRYKDVMLDPTLCTENFDFVFPSTALKMSSKKLSVSAFWLRYQDCSILYRAFWTPLPNQNCSILYRAFWTLLTNQNCSMLYRAFWTPLPNAPKSKKFYSINNTNKFAIYIFWTPLPNALKSKKFITL